MKLRLFCQQNNQSANRPGESARTVILVAHPDEPAAKKSEGAPNPNIILHLTNISLEVAAEYSGGQEYEVTLTPVATPKAK